MCHHTHRGHVSLVSAVMNPTPFCRAPSDFCAQSISMGTHPMQYAITEEVKDGLTPAFSHTHIRTHFYPHTHTLYVYVTHMIFDSLCVFLSHHTNTSSLSLSLHH